MKYEKTSIPILILFCIFIYPVMIKGTTTLSYIYQYGIPFFYIILNLKFVKEITKRQLLIFGLLSTLLILSFLFPVFHSTGDYTYIKISTFVFRKLLIYLFLILVLVKKYKENVSPEHFMYYYSLTHAVFVSGTLLIVFFPRFKTFWFSLFPEIIKSETLLESYGYTFRIGWQGFAGYRMTVHCTWCCIFLLYMFYACQAKYRLKTRTFLPVFALCFLGNMFYGRSGLVLSIVTSLIALFIWNRQHFFKILRFICFVVILIFLIYLLRNQPFFSDWYNWMSSPIINLITEGSFNNVSFTETKEMIFVPEWKTILFGDGYFTHNGHYYMGTDSGFMRNILFWGLTGVFISYGTTFYVILDLKKRNALLCLLILGTFLAFEFKGDVYYEYIAVFWAISFIESIKRKYVYNYSENTVSLGFREDK